MNDVQKAALDRSIKTLSALGCTFAIVDADKELHGSPLTVLDELGSTYAVIDAAGVRHGLVSAVLEKMECQYVITTKDGMKYSNTIVKTPDPVVKPQREFPYGDTRAYVKSFIGTMQIGDTVSIPADKYGLSCCTFVPFKSYAHQAMFILDKQFLNVARFDPIYGNNL